MKTMPKHLAGIKPRRIAARKTQQELADALAVERATVAMWETGRSWPSAALLPQIAAALQCTIDELYVAPEPSFIQLAIEPAESVS